MHAHILQIAASWWRVEVGREAGQALFVNEDAERSYTCDEHVNAKVELQTIN